MKKYVCSLDQGTTSTRCILFTHDGEIAVMSQKEHSQIYPEPGFVEHDPLEIWKNTREVIEEVLIKGKIAKNEIASIGITNQRETTVIWDPETGKPYMNALVWQDTRTLHICNIFKETGMEADIRKKTGLPMATYFSAPKLVWYFEHIEKLRKLAYEGKVLAGTMETWVIWWLTGGPNGGVHVTDVTNASRTMLLNLKTLEWDEDLLDMFQLPASILPRVVSSSAKESYGYTKKDGPFNEEIPVTGALGDQQAALFGQTCFQRGMTKNTYGTGCFLLMNIGEEPLQSSCGLITTAGFKIGSKPCVYALEGSIAITGALVQWVRDNLGLIDKADQIETLASTVTDNGGVYFVPAFSGLYAPYWRDDARGVITGLTRYITKGHIARAVLEATAYQTKDIYDAMIKDSGISIPSLKVDGGMVVNDLLMQFQADILGVPVIRPQIIETTALGAAYASGLAVGFWDSTNDLVHHWKKDKEWKNEMDETKVTALYGYWKKAVEKSMDWV